MSILEAPEGARAKLTQVFRYLQALHQLRNPLQRDISAQPWVLWLHDLPNHSCVSCGWVTSPPATKGEAEVQLTSTSNAETRMKDDVLLRVSRPQLTAPPEPPEEIRPWLLHGWQQVDGTVAIRPSLPDAESDESPDASTQAISFDADPGRPLLLEEWRKSRDTWAEAERPARRAMALFEKLYMLHAQLGRESERLELMLGDGILSWQHSSGQDVHHPILLSRLQIQFHPETPELTIAESDAPPELYTALFRSLSDVSASAIASCREDLEQGGWHPLGGQETNNFLKRFVTQLSPYGKLADECVPEEAQNVPSITRDPVLFLRHRTLGFATALEAILEDLSEREDLPSSLTSIVGIDHPEASKQESNEVPSELDCPNGEDERVLLSKPANAEQLEVVRSLERYGTVLVQGPPGTGKTHTIANLLGHLLAQGKSILVTSHTTKALSILRDQVVEPLQPLCVSVLDEENRPLETAIDEIIERLANSSADMLEREAAVLLRQRSEVLQQLRQSRERLKEARYDEYRPVLVGEVSYTPSEAARYLAERQETAGWIPAPVVLGAELPLTDGEIIELYHSNAVVSLADERELALGFPDPQQVLPPADFERLVTDWEKLVKQDRLYRRDLWKAPTEAEAEPLEALYHQLLQASESLSERNRWRLAVMAAGREGGAYRQVWEDLLTEIEHVSAQAAQAQPTLWRFALEIPEDCLPGQIEQVLDEMWGYCKVGGKLNSFQLMRHREWKMVLEQTRVNHCPPELPEHIEALRTLARLQSARAALLERWHRQVTPLGGPDVQELGAEPEKACQQFIPLLRQSLNWFSTAWLPFEQGLTQQGFRWESFLAELPVNLSEYGDLLRLREAAQSILPPILLAEMSRRLYARYQAQLLGLKSYLEGFQGDTGTTEVVQRLQAATEALDAPAYREAFRRLVELAGKKETLQRRQAILATLENVAPAWASALRAQQGVHGGPELPGNPHEAWFWRQLQASLDQRGKTSLQDLQAQITQLGAELRHVTALLVEKKAWAAQIRRTTPEQQRALQGWKQLMQRAGKGKGKRAPRLLAEARRLMPVCQSAVPVWIMPLSRVVENFDPRRNRFDVVVIDEASQADLMALTAVYMSDQMVVVGDNEQVSPIAVGQRLEEIQQLIDEHLIGIPNAMLYDGQFSIYDLAQTTFKPVCLREHFRCVAPIIEFSNGLSYAGKIKPLRDASEVQRFPHVVAYHVARSEAREKVNEEEAIAVASLLAAASEQPEYAGATFGVISLVGEEQAYRIDALLQRHLPPIEYARRRVQCGNSAHFQGDERDVMFLSLVDVASGDGPLPLRAEGPGNLFKKRFNVAASRARDQLWVVHSLSPETDLKPGDIRRRLIEHVQAPETYQRTRDVHTEQTSELEQQLTRMLIEAGYRVKSQWPVGGYSIQLVVEGGGKRLAIEWDGDRLLTQEQVAGEMARQAILERLGWRFIHLRGSQFFRDSDQVMKSVFARLKLLNIPPDGAPAVERVPGAEREPLKNRVINRAVEIRQEWTGVGEEASPQPLRLLSSWWQQWYQQWVSEKPAAFPKTSSLSLG